MDTFPRHAVCQRNPIFVVKSLGIKYLWGVGKTAMLLHVVSWAGIARHSHAKSRIVEIGNVGLVGHRHSRLLNQPAAGIKDITNGAAEAAHLEPIE
jgi:hypothetical protein